MWTVNELPRMRSQEDIDFMRKNYKVPSKYTNFMDKSDINQIVDFWQENRADREISAGGGAKHGKGKTLRFPWKWEELGHIVGPYVNEILKTKAWRLIAGRMYLVHNDGRKWDTVHTDNWNLVKTQPVAAPTNNGNKFWDWLEENEQHKYYPWRTIVFPLQIKSKVTSTVLFDNVYFGNDCLNWNRDNEQTRNYIENLQSEDLISDEVYDKYLNHVDRDLVKGMEIFDIYDWQLGDALTWDSTQLHVSGAMEFGETKLGMTVWTAHP
jgi:hypothetical protein